MILYKEIKENVLPLDNVIDLYTGLKLFEFVFK